MQRSDLSRSALFGCLFAVLSALPMGALVQEAEVGGVADPGWEQLVNGRAGPVQPDVFHPDGETLPAPRHGGRVIVHIANHPKNINYMVENSAVTRRLLREVHETLLERDWETWQHRGVLASSYVIEDTVILAGGRGDGPRDNVRFGKVTETETHYLVAPISADHSERESAKISKADVESVEYGTVITFDLHEEVKWHDGHVFDAHDVEFSFLQYLNPNVDCDNKRYKFEKFAGVEVLGDLRIRFFYAQQYFKALDSFEDLTILPSHLYNLSDPDNAAYDPEGQPVTDAVQGVFINEHPNNTRWVGLGPYRVTAFESQYVEAERFEDYFDPEHGGWIDTIRWRYVDDSTAKQAVLNGEIDYWDRLRPEDYYGEYTKTEAFQERYYKAIKSYPYIGYMVWNMRRPLFSDPAVRKALSHCFDHEEYVRTTQFGLASPITATWYYFAEEYDRTLEHLPFDLEAAEDLLIEAGWYDRDGDEIIDRDGKAFEFEYLMPTGNKASEILAQTLQKNLAQVGIRMTIATRDWASFSETILDREFDCANLAWVAEVESDPEQIWHSKWAGTRSSNHAGMEDAEVDDLIERIQVELDDAKRNELFARLQERIYTLYPYLFLFNKPLKIAVAKRIRNFRAYAPDPGYRIRDWFIVEEGMAADRTGPPDGVRAE